MVLRPRAKGSQNVASVILDVLEDRLVGTLVVDPTLLVLPNVPRTAIAMLADDLRWSSPSALDVPLTSALEVRREVRRPAVSCLTNRPLLLVLRVNRKGVWGNTMIVVWSLVDEARRRSFCFYALGGADLT